MNLPSWLVKIYNHSESDTFSTNFWKSKPSPEHFFYLFGQLHQEMMAKSLSLKKVGEVQKHLKTKRERFLTILAIFKESLQKQEPADRFKLSVLFPASAFAIMEPKEKALEEMVAYTLSFPMPIQQAKFEGWYTVSYVSDCLNLDLGERDAVIQFLFQTTVGSPNSRPPLRLRIDEERFLFSRIAIMGQGKKVSFGQLLFQWAAECEKDIYKELRMNFFLDKFFFHPFFLDSTASKTKQSFKQYLKEKTYIVVADLLHFPKEFFRKEIYALIESLACQQDIVFFADYLYTAFECQPVFPVDEAEKVLASLLDSDTTHASFLHSAILYHQCLKVLPKMENKDRCDLFQSLYQLEKGGRTFFSKWMMEQRPRAAFLTQALIEYNDATLDQSLLFFMADKVIEALTDPFPSLLCSPLVSAFTKEISGNFAIQKKALNFIDYFNSEGSLPKQEVVDTLGFSFDSKSFLYCFFETFIHFNDWLRNLESKGGHVELFTTIHSLSSDEKPLFKKIPIIGEDIPFQCLVYKDFALFKQEGQTIYEFSCPFTLDLIFYQWVPRCDRAENDLKKIFKKSLKLQNEALYYITTLASKNESFEKNLQLISGCDLLLYPFLHKLIYYNQLKARYKLDFEEQRDVFQVIYSTDSAQRKMYDEGAGKGSLLEMSAFLNYSKKNLSSTDRAHILLKFSRIDVLQKSFEYLDFKGHIQWIEKIQCDVGFQLPASVIADLLFLQTINLDVTHILEEFIKIKDTIVQKYLTSIEVPYELYQTWDFAGKNLIASLKTIQLPDSLIHRQQTYDESTRLLAALLQFASYPKASFHEYIPSSLNEINHLQGSWQPVFLKWKSGPSRNFRWNKKDNSFDFIVYLQKQGTVSSFEIHLNISNEKWINSFFFVLKNMVDSFGSELNQEKMGNLKIDSKEADNKFDYYVGRSSALKTLWEQHRVHFGEDAVRVKKEIFRFISELRSGWKKLFFSPMK